MLVYMLVGWWTLIVTKRWCIYIYVMVRFVVVVAVVVRCWVWLCVCGFLWVLGLEQAGVTDGVR